MRLGIVILTLLSCPVCYGQTSRTRIGELEFGNQTFQLRYPKNLKLSKTVGVDFVVYSLKERKSADTIQYGSIYLGYYPDLFGEGIDDCRIDRINGQILGQEITWTLYQCEPTKLGETMLEDENGMKLHAFITANSTETFQTYSKIIETLTRK